MDYYDSENYNVDYDYYINQANKIIHAVDGTEERLEQERKEALSSFYLPLVQRLWCTFWCKGHKGFQ